ncbi:hypothetical protein V2W45_1466924 [Cenococcum geophilum]
MGRDALKVREVTLRAKYLNTLTSVNNLRLVLLRQGKYKEAKAMHWRALEGYKKVLRLEYLDTLTKAEAMHWRALEGSKKVLKRKYLDTLTSVNNLRWRALEVGEKVLKREHLSILTSVSNLRSVL